MLLPWLILAIGAPNPTAPPFQFYAARRNGAMFMDQRNHRMFFSCGDEIFHSGWLLVDVRPKGGGNSTAIVVRESDGKLAIFFYDWLASRLNQRLIRHPPRAAKDS